MWNPKLVKGKKEYEINSDRYTIGRDNNCSLCVVIGLISRTEAVISKRADGHYLRCDGRGGTKLKRGNLEKRVEGEIKLQNKDIILIGGKDGYTFVTN